MRDRASGGATEEEEIAVRVHDRFQRSRCWSHIFLDILLIYTVEVGVCAVVP
jgi:hypothetical protein